MDSRPPCHYCKDGYEEVGGSDVGLAWHCTRCGMTASAERVHDVYDAAMAWKRARYEHDLKPTSLTGVGLELAEDRLEDACSRAEEVERAGSDK